MKRIMVAALLLALSALGYAEEQPPQFVLMWGIRGSQPGAFDEPAGIDVDAAGNVYVIDTRNDRVQKFTSTGVFLATWTFADFNAWDIALDHSGNVYVVNSGFHSVQQHDPDGVLITKWGSLGTSDGMFNTPLALAVGPSGQIYVADTGNNRIQKFTSSGVFIQKWGSSGIGDGQFTGPRGIAVDANENVFVSDASPRIQKFSSSGAFITAWGSLGSGDGQFLYVEGLTADANGNIYAADGGPMESGNARVQKFSSDGTFLVKWGTRGNAEGQFGDPRGVAIDGNGSIYVSDPEMHRIQKFAPSPIAVKMKTWSHVKADYRQKE